MKRESWPSVVREGPRFVRAGDGRADLVAAAGEPPCPARIFGAEPVPLRNVFRLTRAEILPQLAGQLVYVATPITPYLDTGGPGVEGYAAGRRMACDWAAECSALVIEAGGTPHVPALISLPAESSTALRRRMTHPDWLALDMVALSRCDLLVAFAHDLAVWSKGMAEEVVAVARGVGPVAALLEVAA